MVFALSQDTKDKKMAKESLEMLFRELKALESSSTDATQVYQVATLLTHAHTAHCTLNIESYKCALFPFKLPTLLHPSFLFTPLQSLHHTTTSHSYCGFALILPSLTLSPCFLPSPQHTYLPSHSPVTPYLSPSPPLPTPPHPQTAEAVAVLQARELIVSTLTHWPWGAQKVISLPLVFGSQDIMKTFGMIDLISNMEPADDVNKVGEGRDLPMLQACAVVYKHTYVQYIPLSVILLLYMCMYARMLQITQNIMEYGDPQEVSKLVLVAAECMGELVVGTQMKESPHPLGEGKAGKPEKVCWGCTQVV